eukprot:CAMPEP_0178477326 /NCGR_PEP_ID=MMETSP0696-20121128/4075_1 /TAXON_ID=265572 /ORGANISM="Extubocellulus spinifer, Strain CCMP396" /LENGTH=392 /DNA_ID=CAMNT_0020104637 /DNA_START=17 /DNA_END=1195 /DNA_ORIENTATION=-
MASTAASKVLVCGSGCIGLRTAIELLNRNVSVHLRSARPPLDPSTCSVGAGGLWMPYHCEDSRVDKWAAHTLDELLSYQSTSGGDSPVEIVPVVVLKKHHHGPKLKNFIRNDERLPNEVDDDGPLPAWTKDPRLDFQHLAVEMLAWQNAVHKLRIPSEATLKGAGYMHAWLFRPPIVDAPRMLNSMMLEVDMHENTVDVNTDTEYESLEHMVEDAKSLGCDSVVNCSGLGARDICGDEEIVGGRGVLLHYDRMCPRRPDPHGAEPFPNDAAIMVEEPPWGNEIETAYVIPRGDVLVVGGTYLEGDTETNVRPEERERLTKNAWTMGIDTEKAEPVDSWVGFRPSRPMTRLEVDTSGAVGNQGIKIVHNYGHGGSGWTVFVGAAKEAASLVVG